MQSNSEATGPSSKAVEFLIDSEKRNNYLTTQAGDCVIPCGDVVLDGDYALINGFITNSAYTIDSNTNVLRFSDNITTRSAQVVVGYYNANTIASAVQTALNAAGSSLTFTVQYNNVTSKLTISANGNFILFDSVTDPQSTICKILGIVATNSLANSVTCARPINLAYNSLGFLLSIVESKTNSINVSDKAGTFQFYFPCQVNYGEVITLQDYHANKIIKLENTSKLTVNVKNTHGKVLDMNNGGWQLTLRKIYSC